MTLEKNIDGLSILELNPSEPAEAVLIWLHGLGATNEDFLPVAHDLKNLTGLSLRFVFPQAPSRPVTVNQGYVMPAWYDITSFEQDGEVDHKGIVASVHQLKHLIDNELKRGFTSEQIFLAGFSQGCVVVLSTLVSYSKPLGGVIGLSGYLPQFTLPLAAYTTPVFLAHGKEDTVVPYYFGQVAFEALKNANYSVTWHSYEMPHAVCEEEVRELGKWLSDIIRK